MFDLKQRLQSRLVSRCIRLKDRTVTVLSRALTATPGTSSTDIVHAERTASGHLILFDEALLSIEAVVDDIVSWRNAVSKTFSDYSQVTRSDTIAYLKSWTQGADRAFFALLDADDHFVGHLGAIQRGDAVCSFENFRRGISGPSSSADLFFAAELGLLDLLKTCDVHEVVLETMSYNVPLIAMHQEAGFVVVAKSPITSRDRPICKNGVPIAEEMYRRFFRVEMSCRLGSDTSPPPSN